MQASLVEEFLTLAEEVYRFSSNPAPERISVQAVKFFHFTPEGMARAGYLLNAKRTAWVKPDPRNTATDILAMISGEG
jgi:hypothetical protein